MALIENAHLLARRCTYIHSLLLYQPYTVKKFVCSFVLILVLAFNRYLYQSIELAASSRFIALNYKLQNIDRKEIDQSIDRAEIDRLLK